MTNPGQMQSELWSWFSQEEKHTIEKILENASPSANLHPLVKLLYCGTDCKGAGGTNYIAFDIQRLTNFWWATQEIRKKFALWMVSSNDKSRLLNIDIGTCASVIAELKAFGYCLNAFRNVERIPEQKNRKTADLKVIGAKNTKVEIEVHAKNWSNQMEHKLTKHYSDFKAGKTGHSRGNIRVAEILIQPFAGDKPDRSHIRDAVSKITSIQQKSNQFSPNTPGVLWLDFEQPIWDLNITPEDAFPLYTRGGKVFSGRIWSALYGHKGLPLLDCYPDASAVNMEHDGMFADRNISGVLVSFARQTILFENPYTANPLPKWFRNQCFNLRWFALQYSIYNVTPKRAHAIVNMQKRNIEGVTNFGLIPFW